MSRIGTATKINLHRVIRYAILILKIWDLIAECNQDRVWRLDYTILEHTNQVVPI